MVHSGTISTTIDLNPLYLEILFPNSQRVNYITRFPIRTNIEGIPYWLFRCVLGILKEYHFKYNQKSERVIILKKVRISMVKAAFKSTKKWCLISEKYRSASTVLPWQSYEKKKMPTSIYEITAKSLEILHNKFWINQIISQIVKLALNKFGNFLPYILLVRRSIPNYTYIVD